MSLRVAAVVLPLMFCLSTIFLAAGCNKGTNQAKDSGGKKSENPPEVVASDKKEKQAEKKDIKADFAVTSEELAKELHTDGTKALEKYTGKIVEVTGEVSGIELRPEQGDVIVFLKGAKTTKEGDKIVVFPMRPDQTSTASKLSRNQKVKIYAYNLRGLKLEEIDKSKVIIISAPDLAKEYSNSVEAATKKYNDTADIIVFGEVEDLTAREGTSFTFAYLKGDRKMRVRITCDTKKLQKGQLAYIRSQLPYSPSVDGNEIHIDSGNVVNLK